MTGPNNVFVRMRGADLGVEQTFGSLQLDYKAAYNRSNVNRGNGKGAVLINRITNVGWILDRTQAPLDEASYQNLVNSTEQFDQQIENGPDVRWMYLTAWATEDGRVNFRPDVYGLDGTDFILGQPQPKTY